MRTPTTAQSYVVAGSGRAELLKVEVKDSGGTFRDMSTYPGFNAVDSVTWSEGVDDPHTTAEITLRREVESFNLSPFVEGSPSNLAFTYGGALNTLLGLNREVKVSVAVIPADGTVQAYDWILVFHGRIDTIDAAQGERITLQCRDLGGLVMDTFIENEQVHAFASVGGAPVALRIWEPNTAYSLGEYLLPSEARRDVGGTKAFYEVTTAGTSDSTEPTWPTSGTVADGTAVHTAAGTTDKDGGFNVEDVMQAILDANGLSSVTLYTPSSPGWAITQYLQQREPVLQAIRNLALQIGWDVRYKWDSGSSTFKLTFFEPDRAKTTPDYTFSATDYEDITGLKVDKAGIRNVVRVVYSDASSLDPTGAPLRKTVTVTDSGSITSYGRLFMEISEDSASQIDSVTEATAMANACLADLKDPEAEQEASMVYGFPWAELGDLYRFEANGRHYDSDQDLALVGVQHSAADGHITSSFTCRGKPSGGHARWHQVSTAAKPGGRHRTSVFESAEGVAVAASSVVGGTKLIVTGTTERISFGDGYEFHVSTSSGFTPSASTLQTISTSREVTIPQLVPGTTYYAKVVPRIRNASKIARAQPSDEVTFTAGRGSATHLSPDPEWGRLPLNGGFETQLDASGPPDHWTVQAGTWATHWTTGNSSGVSGSRYLVMSAAAGVSQEMRSATFGVDGSETYGVEFVTKNVSGTGNFYVDLNWLDADKASLSTDSIEVVSSGSSWSRYGGPNAGIYLNTFFTAPSTARFARVHIRKKTAADALSFAIDQVRVKRTEPVSTLVFAASSLASADGTQYMRVGAAHAAAGATEYVIRAPMSGVLRGLYVNAITAGSSIKHDFTVRTNGSGSMADSAITCALDATGGGGAPTSAEDASNLQFVLAGDRISVKVVTSGAPGTGYSDVFATLAIRA